MYFRAVLRFNGNIAVTDLGQLGRGHEQDSAVGEFRIQIVVKQCIDAGADLVLHLDHRDAVVLIEEVFGSLHTGEAGTDDDDILSGQFQFLHHGICAGHNGGFIGTRDALRDTGFAAGRDEDGIGSIIFQGLFRDGLVVEDLCPCLFSAVGQVLNRPVHFLFMRRLVGGVQLTAGAGLFFEDDDIEVSGSKLSCGSQAGRAGADNDDSSALAVLRDVLVFDLAAAARVQGTFGRIEHEGIVDQRLETGKTADAALDISCPALFGLLRPLGVGE